MQLAFNLQIDFSKSFTVKEIAYQKGENEIVKSKAINKTFIP